MKKRSALKKWLVAGGVLAVLGGAGVKAALHFKLKERVLARLKLDDLLAPPPPSGPRVVKPLAVAEVIYDGKFGKDWQDWGWGPHEIPEAGGPARVGFVGYGGIIFRHTELTERYGGVSFRFKAPRAWGDFLHVSVAYKQKEEAGFPKVALLPHHVADVGDGWREALVSMKELNPGRSPIDRVQISARKQVSSDWVEIDKVVLTKANPMGDAPGGTRSANVGLLCDRPVTKISPLIYGVSGAVWETGSPAGRIGGNPITRLNWDIGNAWNVGSDWFFENTKGQDVGIYDVIDDAAKSNKYTAMVVPLIGWVAKDTTSYGFPVSKLGPQEKTDPYKSDAGNGKKPDGKKLAPGSPTETSVEAPPEKIQRWIATVRAQDRVRGSRGVNMYILDNEPSLWDETHRDVHPEPVTYDELLDRTLAYGGAIRRADPEAVIAGPAEWGWTGYFYSAKDRAVGLTLRPDRRMHGDTPLVPWYLRRLADHEKETGQRLLDVLDLHYYPQAQGIYGGENRTDAEGAALRIRSTRSLWDPEYTDESWIKERIQLIPRLKEWVAQNYPGRKISLGEWSFGAEKHISGALATAEALGRFGQTGLDAAFYWHGPSEGTATYWAFRAYRNFDGKGGTFQELSIPTRMAEGVSVFASRNQAGSRVVVVLLNLDPDAAISVKLDTMTCGAVVSRDSYSYAEDFDAIKPEIRKSSGARELIELLPPYSIRVVDLTVVPLEVH